MQELQCFYCGTTFYSDDSETDGTILFSPHRDRIGCRNSFCQSTRRESTEIKKYRKKPVVVEIEGPLKVEREICTLEGRLLARVGDYVITGVHGEKYPIKPDILEETYELVEEGDSDG